MSTRFKGLLNYAHARALRLRCTIQLNFLLVT